MNSKSNLYSPEHNIPQGVILMPLSDFQQRHGDLYERFYNRMVLQDAICLQQNDPYIRRPGILSDDLPPKDIRVLYVSPKQQIQEPITLTITDSVRHLILVDQRSCVRIMADFSQIKTSLSHLCELFLLSDSRVELVAFYDGDNYDVKSRLLAEIGRNATLDTFMITGRHTTLDAGCKMVLSQPGATCNFYGLSLLGGNDSVILRTVMSHESGSCDSNQWYKAVVDGEAVSDFFGTIYVARDAQQTAAYQQNNNIVLSSDAQARTKPQLEIYADDVKCNHGATVGQLDPEAIYYMRQRGIPSQEARKLQIAGFAKEIFDKMSDSPQKEHLLQWADRMINEL